MHSRISFYMAALLAFVIPCQAFSQDNTAAVQTDPIAQATDSVINTITSLAPQFQACYGGEATVNDHIKLHFEYDETGEVYYIESSTDNKKLLGYECYAKVIPKSFNFNLPDSTKQEISMYPERVQKFGKLSFSHNVKTQKTFITSSQPIGTKYTPEEWNGSDRHYLKYQRRKADNAETDELKATMSSVEADLKTLEPQLAACLETEKSPKIKLSYNSKGIIKSISVDGANKETTSCVRDILKAHTFPMDVSKIVDKRMKEKIPSKPTPQHKADQQGNMKLSGYHVSDLDVYADTGKIVYTYQPETKSFVVEKHHMIGRRIR